MHNYAEKNLNKNQNKKTAWQAASYGSGWLWTVDIFVDSFCCAFFPSFSLLFQWNAQDVKWIRRIVGFLLLKWPAQEAAIKNMCFPITLNILYLLVWWNCAVIKINETPKKRQPRNKHNNERISLGVNFSSYFYPILWTDI